MHTEDDTTHVMIGLSKTIWLLLILPPTWLQSQASAKQAWPSQFQPAEHMLQCEGHKTIKFELQQKHSLYQMPSYKYDKQNMSTSFMCHSMQCWMHAWETIYLCLAFMWRTVCERCGFNWTCIKKKVFQKQDVLVVYSCMRVWRQYIIVMHSCMHRICACCVFMHVHVCTTVCSCGACMCL